MTSQVSTSSKKHASHKYATLFNDKKTKYAFPSDQSKTLYLTGIVTVQYVAGTLLYYAWAIDQTFSPARYEIVIVQSHSTESTKKEIIMLLDYIAMHPNAKIRYNASDMVLHILILMQGIWYCQQQDVALQDIFI